MRRFAITGGPCAGKSEVLDFLREEYEGKLLAMKEVASVMFEHLLPLAGRDLSFSPKWASTVQQVILPAQMGAEESWTMACQERGIPVLVTDRGVMDGAAYVGGPAIFAERFGLDIQEVHASYEMVIHLESLATGNPALFEQARHNNPQRRETLEEAQALENNTREAWAGHPNWFFVPNRGTKEQLVAQVLDLLSPYLDNEVERKWWLPYGVPEDLKLGTGTPVLQGYLVTEGGELRVRRMGPENLIAAKGDGSISRREWERLLPAWVADIALPTTEGRQVRKTRYFISYPGLKSGLELDVYCDHLDGLVTFEAEFSGADPEAIADAFQLPEWAVRAGAIEVTDDPAFKNKALAVKGLPDRARAYINR